jgi:hypothetical protein
MQRHADGSATLTADEVDHFEELKHLYSGLAVRLGLLDRSRQEENGITVFTNPSAQAIFDEVVRLKRLAEPAE